MWGTAVLILWSRCPCSLVDKGSWTGAIFWRSFCDVTLTSNVISSRLGSTLSGQMIRIRDRLIGSQSSQKCQSFLLRGSFYSASEIPWGRIGVNGSTWAYSNTLIFIGPKSNHCLSLSVTHCCKLQCNACINGWSLVETLRLEYFEVEFWPNYDMIGRGLPKGKTATTCSRYKGLLGSFRVIHTHNWSWSEVNIFIKKDPVLHF